MTIAVLLLVFVLGLVLVAAVRQHQDYAKKIAVMRWVDEREFYFARIALEAGQIKQLGAVEHIGSIDGTFVARFGPNGPKVFVPSDTGLRQIALAMSILEERENWYVNLRDGLMTAHRDLVYWEKTHPMPDLGMPYDEPPRPVKMPPPKTPQDTKPVPRFSLDTPIYDPNRKALNR